MVRTLFAVSSVAIVLAGCDAKAPGDQVEKKIMELAKDRGVELSKVSCPRSLTIEVNGTFECQATPAAGDTLRVVGTITSKSGKNFEYSLAFPEPTYNADKLAAWLTESLSKQPVGAPKSVDCGKPGIYKIPVDLTVICTVVDPSDKTVKIKMKLKADETVDSYEVQP